MMNSLVKVIFWTVLIVGLLAVMLTAREAKAQPKCMPFEQMLEVERESFGRIPFASGIASGGIFVIFVSPADRSYALVLRPKQDTSQACLLGIGADFSPIIPKHLEQGEPT